MDKNDPKEKDLFLTLFRIQSDLLYAFMVPNPPKEGEYNRICSTAEEAEKLCSQLKDGRCPYSKSMRPVLDCFLHGRAKFPDGRSERLKAFFNLQTKLVSFDSAFLQIRDIASFEKKASFSELRDVVGVGVPKRDMVFKKSGLPNDSDSGLYEAIIDYSKQRMGQYTLLAQTLAHGTKPYLVIRDGEIAFFSLLYFVLLAGKILKWDRDRLVKWYQLDSDKPCKDLLPAFGDQGGGATSRQVFLKLGLITDIKTLSPTDRFVRMLLWLGVQNKLLEMPGGRYESLDFPAKIKIDSKLKKELKEAFIHLGRWIDTQDRFPEMVELVMKTRSEINTKTSATNDEVTGNGFTLYYDLYERGIKAILKNISSDIIREFSDQIFNKPFRSLIKMKMAADKINNAARVLDLQIEYWNRVNDTYDRGLVVFEVVSPRIEEREESIYSMTPLFIAFFNIVGTLPPETETLLLEVTGPLQSIANTLALIGISAQFLKYQQNQVAREKQKSTIPYLNVETWRELRDDSYGLGEHKSHHKKGGGAKDPKESALLDWLSKSNYWNSFSPRVQDILMEAGYSIDGASLDGFLKTSDMVMPPVRALTQNRNDDCRRYKWGGFDLTQFFERWRNDLRPSFTRVFWDINPNHDYLWFNVFAMRNALDDWLQNPDVETHLYAMEYLNPSGLLLAIFQREPADSTNPLAAKDQKELKWNPYFPCSIDESDILHDDGRDLLRLMKIAGAAWLLYSGKSLTDIDKDEKPQKYGFCREYKIFTPHPKTDALMGFVPDSEQRVLGACEQMGWTSHLPEDPTLSVLRSSPFLSNAALATFIPAEMAHYSLKAVGDRYSAWLVAEVNTVDRSLTLLRQILQMRVELNERTCST